MSKCGKGCMPECEYFTTGGCISPFNCMYKEESGYINSATSGTVIYTVGMNMTNEELKKKICEVMSQKQTYGIKEEFKTEDLGHGGWQAWTETTKVNNEELANALIAAGIGDVSKLKNHRVIAEYSLVPDDDNPYIIPNVPLRVTQLYSGEEVEKIVKERKELKDELRSKVEYIHEQDEVVKEYKHRAEVAERALRKAVSVLDAEYRAFGVNRENKTEQRIKNFIEQAEKELAEERKDD